MNPWGRPKGRKKCPLCGTENLDEFYTCQTPSARRTVGSLSTYCKACTKVKNTAWRFTHREEINLRRLERLKHKRPIYSRDKHLVSQHGMTEVDYQRRFDAQGGVCAICHRPETIILRGRVKALAVDHDHSTGGIRGLLCFTCNAAVGMFRDSPVILECAAKYLSKYQAGLQLVREGD